MGGFGLALRALRVFWQGVPVRGQPLAYVLQVLVLNLAELLLDALIIQVDLVAHGQFLELGRGPVEVKLGDLFQLVFGSHGLLQLVFQILSLLHLARYFEQLDHVIALVFNVLAELDDFHGHLNVRVDLVVQLVVKVIVVALLVEDIPKFLRVLVGILVTRKLLGAFVRIVLVCVGVALVCCLGLAGLRLALVRGLAGSRLRVSVGRFFA